MRLASRRSPPGSARRSIPGFARPTSPGTGTSSRASMAFGTTRRSGSRACGRPQRPELRSPRSRMRARRGSIQTTTTSGCSRRSTARSRRASASADDLALFDVALSVDLVRLLADLHYGRANPGDVDFGLDVPPPGKHELAGLIAKAVREGRVRELPSDVEPDLQAYQLLLRALARYRALAQDRAATPVVVEPTVRPGNAFAQAPELSRWLAALGDLPPGAEPPGARYEGALVEAVERFQGRHGIDPDGVIGPETARALVVPAVRARPTDRARARALSLDPRRQRAAHRARERAGLRAAGTRRIDPAEGPALSMRVVVGRALAHRRRCSPRVMKTVVFAPYWNVPRSIVTEEMLPKLRSNLGYLAEQEMEIVSGDRVLPATEESVELLASHEARLRQRPGDEECARQCEVRVPEPARRVLARHALAAGVSRERRDFSHGCVRVEDADGARPLGARGPARLGRGADRRCAAPNRRRSRGGPLTPCWCCCSMRRRRCARTAESSSTRTCTATTRRSSAR